MTDTNMQNIKDFFTDNEWDAISSALNDFQDYGDSEAETANDIQIKIASLFVKNWFSLYSHSITLYHA